MPQISIGERIKFLLDAQGGSIRKFARMLDVSDTNIRNYIERGTKPSSDALERLLQNIPHLNPAWLLTGEGEPFLSDSTSGANSEVNYTGNNYGNNVGSNRGGLVTQHHGPHTSPDERDTKLVLAQQEIESLRTQLAMQAALLASKDETIAVLKSAFSRPN